jgi:hypothetical protein
MFQLLLFVMLQGASVERVFEKALDNTNLFSLQRNSTPRQVTFSLVIEEKANRNRSWQLAAFDASAYVYEVARIDRNSVVLRCVGDYGFAGTYIKVFFDLASKKELKRMEFTNTDLSQIPDSEVQRIIGVPPDFLKELKPPFEPAPLPRELLVASLPQSTYSEFARARPARVRDGYAPGSTIEEKIERYQVVGNKIWFGKSFYDGEGTTGVGAIGFFDLTTKKFTFLRIREVADWSVSSLLVEGNTIWAGLVGHPEGADYSGGLLRHDLTSGVTRKYPVDDVIFRISRWRDALYLTTSNGIYVLKGDRFTRYRVEPDINGKPVIISDQL